ncbi:MAG: SDR family NAD(P)-dependent oxidoreductase [Oscillospiraceae bacterium]|nr:SDR family NAD(P)-dependent oxidoreductase [Oscillospiraceae bacterium]
MRMNGNAVLITGGATGIGYSLAKYFHARGNKVLICGRREDRLAQAADKLPGIQAFRCDVTDLDSCVALHDHVRDFLPDLNILINNAGIQRNIDLTRGIDELIGGENEIRVNLQAPIYLSALFTPMLSGRDNAAIVNVSSGLAFMPDYAVGMPIYHVTKAGLHAFSVVQRKQLSPLGIRVIEIIPPAVESELNPEGRRGRSATNSPYFMASDEFVEKALAKMEQDIDEIRLGR